jgi:hypothetical protein
VVSLLDSKQEAGESPQFLFTARRDNDPWRIYDRWRSSADDLFKETEELQGGCAADSPAPSENNVDLFEKGRITRFLEKQRP